MSRPRARVRGMDELLAKLERLRREQAKATNREVKRTLLAIQNGARRRVRVDRGELRSSIAHEVRSEATGMAGDPGASGRAGTNKVHGPPTEFGRRPGKMPPVDEIREWAKRKGIDPNAAFVIARSIARHGTKPAPFLFPSFEEERPRHLRRLARALAAVNKKVSRS